MDHNMLKRNSVLMAGLQTDREKLLEGLVNDVKDRLALLPHGRIRISMRGGRPYYYLRQSGEDKNGIYIKRNEMDLAAGIIQREYLENVLLAAEREMALLNELDFGRFDGLRGELGPGKDELITPIFLSDEEFIGNWKGVQYQGKSFEGVTTGFYTQNGERVRSKAEVMIADVLRKYNVPYKYECPLYLPGLGWIYPDFTCLNVRLRREFYLEHFGLMGDPAYVEKAKDKIYYYAQYEMESGKKMIFLTESAGDPLDTRRIDYLVKRFLI